MKESKRRKSENDIAFCLENGTKSFKRISEMRGVRKFMKVENATGLRSLTGGDVCVPTIRRKYRALVSLGIVTVATRLLG